MAFPVGAAVLGGSNLLSGLLGRRKGYSGIDLNTLSDLLGIFNPQSGANPLQYSAGFLKDLTGRQGQSTYLTPAQLADYMAKLTEPAIGRLERAYAPLRRGAAAEFASRGQLFGGSLTGRMAGLETSYGQNLADILGQAASTVGGLDINLGAQRQFQAQQLLAELIRAQQAGLFGLTGAAQVSRQ